MSKEKSKPKYLNFTTKNIDSLPLPKDEKYKVYYDKNNMGLSLMLTSRGYKTFYIYTRIKGQKSPIKRKIGRYPYLSLKDAKEAAKGILGDIARNTNPFVSSKDIITFKEIYDDYISELKTKNTSPRTVHDKVRNYELYLSDFGKIDINTFNRQFFLELKTQLKKDIIKHIQETRPNSTIKENSGNRTANIILDTIKYAFDTAILNDKYHKLNPLRKLSLFSERPRERKLTDEELRRLGNALKKELIEKPEKIYQIYAIKLLLATGLRKSELLSAKWDNIEITRSKDNKKVRILWVVPKKDKKHTPKPKPLSTIAVKYLAVIKRYNKKNNFNPEYIFPGKGNKGHLKDIKNIWSGKVDTLPKNSKRSQSIQKRTPGIRDKIGLKDITIHDLRHTAASISVDNNQSIYSTSEFLFHSKIDTTQKYVHPDIEITTKVANTIGSKLEETLEEKEV